MFSLRQILSESCPLFLENQAKSKISEEIITEIILLYPRKLDIHNGLRNEILCHSAIGVNDLLSDCSGPCKTSPKGSVPISFEEFI